MEQHWILKLNNFLSKSKQSNLDLIINFQHSQIPLVKTNHCHAFQITYQCKKW